MKTTEQKIEELEKQLQELKNEVANQNQPKFKKGDFIYGEFDELDQKFVFIFEKTIDSTSAYYKALLFLNSGNIYFDSSTINYDTIRLATKSERKQLINKLREIGKDWAAERREIVDYPWRAEKGECYYRIDNELDVACFIDESDSDDNSLYKVGNYFKTRELAEEAAEKVQALLLTLKHS